MIKTKTLVIIIFALFCYYFYNEGKTETNALKEIVEETISQENDDPVNDAEDTNDPISLELKKFYTDDPVICKRQTKEYETLLRNVDNYVQRYISLFLVTANLLEYKVNDLNDVISIDLEILLTGEDLEFLQKYSIGKLGKSNYMRNLSRLDEIMSKIASLKKRSFMEESARSLTKFFVNFIFRILGSPTFYHYLPFLVILIVTYIISCYLPAKSLCFYMSIILNSMIFWDGVLLYKKKLKEVEIVLNVRQMRLKEIPKECFPENIQWYNYVLDYFTQNKCLQYHQLLNTVPEEEVSLLKCILDTFALYYIRTPLNILAACNRDYSLEIASVLPWPFRGIAALGMSPMFTVILLFFLLIIFGKRLRLSFFGAVLELGNGKTAPETSNTTSVTDSQVKSIENRKARKLKPWTKSRFDRDFIRRRKLPWINWGSGTESPQQEPEQQEEPAPEEEEKRTVVLRGEGGQ